MIPCTLDVFYEVQDESIPFLTSALERQFALIISIKLSVSIECRLQAADCRLQVGFKMQTTLMDKFIGTIQHFMFQLTPSHTFWAILQLPPPH